MGRLQATGLRTKQERQRAERADPSGVDEVLTVSIDRGLVSAEYHLESAAERISVRIVRRDAVELAWTCRDASDRSRSTWYTQTPGRDVTLALIDESGGQREYRAASLWHLAMTHPEICGNQLSPLLRIVRPDWPFEDEVDKIRTSLLAPVSEPGRPSLADVRALVGELSHPDFRVRQRADRALRASGPAVLCLLTEFDSRELDAEQRLRIRQICQSVAGEVADSPLRVTTWLANDKRIWLGLLDAADAQARTMAPRELARILQRPVKFDPEAAPQVRAEQLAALRTQCLR